MHFPTSAFVNLTRRSLPLFAVWLGCAVSTCVAQSGKSGFTEAMEANQELRTSVWKLLDNVSNAKHPRDAKYRNRKIENARNNLAKAKAAAARLRKDIAALEKTGSLKETVKILKRRLKDYENELEKGASQLAELAPKLPRKSPPGKSPRKKSSPKTSPPKSPSKQPRRKTSPSVPHPSLETAIAQLELKEMYDEMLLFNAYLDRELYGWGLHNRVMAAFKKHGATDKHGWVQPWAMSLGFAAHAMSMHSYWKPLKDAIRTFRYQLRNRTEILGTHKRYVAYLQNRMKKWRKVNKRKMDLTLKMIDLIGQRAAALEARDDKLAKLMYDRSQAVAKQIKRKDPLNIKSFPKWVEDEAKPKLPADKTELSEEDVVALIGKVKKKLADRGLPTKWIDELLKNPPGISFDRKTNEDEKSAGLYYPLSNDIALKNPVDPKKPKDTDLATLAHELFHHWYDTVPYWIEFRLSKNQNDAVAAFLQHRLLGYSQEKAIHAAAKYGISQGGGDRAESVRGLYKVNRLWKGESLFVKKPKAKKSK